MKKIKDWNNFLNEIDHSGIDPLGEENWDDDDIINIRLDTVIEVGDEIYEPKNVEKRH